MRLLKNEEIKFFRRQVFSEHGFLQKIINISDFKLDLFIITRATFYENFKALRLNLNEQRASEKKAFFGIFNFFSIELIDRF